MFFSSIETKWPIYLEPLLWTTKVAYTRRMNTYTDIHTHTRIRTHTHTYAHIRTHTIAMGDMQCFAFRLKGTVNVQNERLIGPGSVRLKNNKESSKQ